MAVHQRWNEQEAHFICGGSKRRFDHPTRDSSARRILFSGLFSWRSAIACSIACETAALTAWLVVPVLTLKTTGVKNKDKILTRPSKPKLNRRILRVRMVRKSSSRDERPSSTKYKTKKCDRKWSLLVNIILKKKNLTFAGVHSLGSIKF